VIKVTFKYVGQGDCIIIEWDEKGIGIIDSRKLDGDNPALDHIIDRKIKKIKFLLLSHPHRDHYTGFNDILDYCEKANIGIELFGYTTDINRKYLESVLMPYEDKNILANLFRKVAKLDKEGLINKRGLINDLTSNIKLTDNVFIRILAPSQEEKDEFYKTFFKDDLSLKKQPSPNLLSLVTSIESNEWQILLTADAVKSCLKRIGIKELKNFDKSMVLGQVPHHGSIENHYKEFWKRRNFETGTPLAISVGPNKHGHPSETVIEELDSLGYDIHSTNPSIVTSIDAGSDLDLISDLNNADIRTTDLEYQFAE